VENDTVKGNRIRVCIGLKRTKVAALFKLIYHPIKVRVEMVWRYGVKQVSYLYIAGDFRHAKQGDHVITPFSLVHISLVGQKRGRLHEKDGKSGCGRIGYLIAGVVTWLTVVWQLLPARLESFHDETQ